MHVSVLGRVEAIDDAPLALGGPTQRRLLAVLALHHDEVVSVDHLADVTWTDDTRPARAERNVHSYVHRLRSALDGDGELIETVGAGYRLRLEPGSLDAEHFEELAETARRQAAAGESAAALDAVDGALALWHGRPFGEFADEEWAVSEVARLEELRTGLRELRCEVMIDAGRAAEVIPELESLARDNPYRERPRALQMQALYHAGRQAEALRAFHDFRGLLLDDVGVEPSSELVELDRRIATGALDDPTTSVGRTIGDYELGERLGEGAFAVVYRARQPSLNRDVAVKVVRAELANRPEFVRRFAAEAQMVARIEHPNVVPLYDYWREPDRAYLVMRLMAGGTLERRLDGGPLSARDAADVIEQVASALSAAHDLGVVHRDVKPENVMFDTEGRAYLADFGIALEAAERATPEAALSEGSPLFASPEQLRREPVGPEADVHALGVVAYTVLVGRAPFADSPDEASRLRRQLEDPVPSVRLARPELSDEVDRVVAIATAKRASDRYPTAPSFAAAFAAALTGAAAEPSTRVTRPRVNPYKGLRAFDETDVADFHGRDRLIDELVAALAAPSQPLVSVVGPSGSGKSSVVRAGLVPALRAGRLPGSAGWFVTTMTPGAHPFEALETALLRVAVNPPGSLLEQLRSSERGILRGVRRVLPDDRTEVLVVIDQFEELFTNDVEPAERDLFLDALVAATSEPGSPLRVVATLRADFFDRPLRHQVFAPVLKASAVAVTPLAADELERAIVEPAASVGVSFEPGVVARIVADVTSQPGALPLLQYALTQMFDRADGEVITEADYDAIGGLVGALAQRADELYLGASADERAAIRSMFERLVNLGEGVPDTRRRVLRAELGEAPAAADAIERYGRARLLTLDQDPATRQPTVEVAHEALLTRWPRLRGWLDDDRDALRAHRHLTAATAAWLEHDRDAAELYGGARLDAIDELVTAGRLRLNSVENEFVAASVERRDADIAAERRSRARLRRFATVAALLAVLAITAGAIALVQRGRAEDSRALAEQRATESDVLRLTTESEAALDEDPDLAILLALAAHERAVGSSSGVPSEVQETLLTSARSSRLLARVDGGVFGAMHPDGSLIATDAPGRPDEVVLYDRTYREVGRIDVGVPVGEMRFSPDGSMLLVEHFAIELRAPSGPTGGLASIQIYETDRFTPIHQLGSGCCVESAMFSPNGRYVAASIASEGAGAQGGQRRGLELTRVWDLADPGTVVREFPGEFVIGWLPRSGALVLADGPSDEPHGERFVDVVSGEEVGRLGAPVVGVTVTHTTEDQVVVFGQGSVGLWEEGSTSAVASYEHDGAARGGVVSADGTSIVLTGNDDQAIVIDLATGRQTVLRGHRGGALDALSNLVDDRVVVLQWDGGLLIWDLSPEGPEELGGHVRDVVRFGEMAVSRDGQTVTMVELGDGDDGIAHRYDVATGARLSSSGEYVVAPVLSPSGAVAAGQGDDGGVRVDDVTTGTTIRTSDVCGFPVAVDDSGRWVVVDVNDCLGRSVEQVADPFRVIDLESGRVVVATDRPTIRGAFGPAGTPIEGYVTLNLGFESMELFRLSDGERIGRFQPPGEDGVFFPRFSADGRHLVFGSQFSGAYVIDLESVLGGESDMRNAVVVNPVEEEGPTNYTITAPGVLLTGHSGETVRQWDLATGEEQLVLAVDFPSNAMTTAVTPDGRYLFVSERDGVISRLPLLLDDVVALAHSRVQRELTDAECERYFPAGDCPTDLAPV